MTSELQTHHRISLPACMFIGAVIALVPISVMVFTTETHPEWPSYWRIRPLIVVAFAGAVGGAFSYFMDAFRLGGWKTALTNIICALVFVFGLWIGSVLGLVGTLWN